MQNWKIWPFSTLDEIFAISTVYSHFWVKLLLQITDVALVNKVDDCSKGKTKAIRNFNTKPEFGISISKFEGAIVGTLVREN